MIDARGLKDAEVARLLDTNRQAVGRWAKGRPRIPLKWAKKLGELWGVAPLSIMYTDGELASLSEEAKSAILGGETQRRFVTPMIRGIVAGGQWLDVSSIEFDERPYHNPVAVPPEVDGSEVFILQVLGNSVNKKAQDGGYVVCLPLEASPRSFRAGDWVIAERQRGDLVETTVKQVSRNGDGMWELLPASDDPRHQAPIRLGESDDEKVRVVAFAIDFVNPGTKF
jgi:hypothetical protein